jgi:hypothetical membrane protein
LIDNRVSDLGSTACGRTVANTLICSPLHAVMNLTFVLTGVLILVGLFLTRSMWRRRRTTWGLVLLGVAGAGTMLVGLSPENVNVVLHVIGALNIPAGNVAMILLGLAIWRDRRGMAGFSVVAGVFWAAWHTGRALPGDLDRPWWRTRRTYRALSADHLADRFRTRDLHQETVGTRQS